MGGKRIIKLWNKEWIYDKYVTRKLKGPTIAKILNCSDRSVYNALERFNISVQRRITDLLRKDAEQFVLNTLKMGGAF